MESNQTIQISKIYTTCQLFHYISHEHDGTEH